jgi:orotidine-5'-phosphate decarboxylase
VPVLAPGFGAQGAALADAPATFGTALGAVLPSASRSILGAGPHELAPAIDAAKREVASWPR